jgi:hypothetical protein
MRTSGRMSRTIWPSPRRISTCCQDAASDAVTCLTRGSLFAHIGVDLLQQLRLGLEGGRRDRVLVAVEMGVGAGRRVGQRAGIAALYRRDGIGRAQQGGLRQFAGMGIADRLAGDRAQAKALIGVEIRRLQPAIVEHQRLGLAVFKEEFPVIRARDRVGHDLLQAAFGNVELLDEGSGHGVLEWDSSQCRYGVRRFQSSEVSDDLDEM